MQEKVVDWLVKNSPFEPLLLIALLCVGGFILFYGRPIRNWRHLPDYMKWAIVASLFAIAMLIIIGIDMTFEVIR